MTLTDYDFGITPFVFVYGTLRPGEVAGLQQYTMARTDTVRGTLYSAGRKRAPFPALVPGFTGKVHGVSLRLLDAATLGIMDVYENYPTLYNRVLMHTRHGRVAWTYTWNEDMSLLEPFEGSEWPRRKEG